MPVSLDAATIRDELRSHLAEVLYVEVAEVEDDATFQDLGLDSVLGVELVSVINAKYGLSEVVDAVFDHPTLNKLADYVRERAAEAA
ncbi:acyl carrier protein [Saccharopolyspora shandongensis]|uniref:Acyl carrier protein n=1 Tax=Saccharopolyspora shandongensis TaxID=418495 RepID=A0A1H2R052_9PSEU|nr:acyl carrier protein [Saccharopolyspora shandongensis]SDW12751.1 Acyl carrier protein [Saccharopolyspora shandongensis]